MSSHDYKSAQRPSPDELLVAIADYTKNYQVDSAQAYETARYCLMDTLACGFQALKYPACTRLLGPGGAGRHDAGRLARAGHELRARPGHGRVQHRRAWCAGSISTTPGWRRSGVILPTTSAPSSRSSDYLSRRAILLGEKPLTVRDVLTAMIKAHEIQGVLALENSFNRVGLDHVLLVRVASTAVATAMLGGSLEQIVNALSNAWIDGGALRTYRHAPNTGSRKSWAAGDATSRAVRHALFALKSEMGYPSALSAKTWGFQDVLFKGKPLTLAQPLGSYVMENVLFKISFPAEFHAQTAVECAMALHPQVKDKLALIERIVIETQEPGVRIIDKTGPLANPGGSRSLHPVHGGRAADLRPPHRRGLRRRRSPPIRASTCCARKMEVRENTDVHEGILRARQAPHRQRAAHLLQRRQPEARAAHRLSRSAIASAAPRACRCWCRSSRRPWPRTSRRNKPKPSRRCSRARISTPCR